MPEGELITALHYVGYEFDRGGILAVVRALAAEGRFRCLLGVNPGFRPGTTTLERLEFPPVEGDRIALANLVRTRRAAQAVRAWLHADPRRVFHGHSRAGLLVALWLHRWGERRLVTTVHCYGRQRWFYRWAAGVLKNRIRFLTPAMQRYYGVGDESWTACAPGCVRVQDWAAERSGVSGGVLRFGAAGGLVRVKEWERIIDAVRELPPDVPVQVIHAGGEDGSAESARYAEELRRQAEPLGARWVWRGQVADMKTFFAGIDALIVASAREGFSIAALEAAAAGVPVLAADGGGNRDLIEAAHLGWLFEAGKPGALATAMRELAASGAVRKWRWDGEAFRRFTAESSAALHEAWYREVMRDAP